VLCTTPWLTVSKMLCVLHRQLKAADLHFPGNSQVTFSATSQMTSALHVLMQPHRSAHLKFPDTLFAPLQGSCNDEDPQCGNIVAMKFFVKPSELVRPGALPTCAVQHRQCDLQVMLHRLCACTATLVVQLHLHRA
jgi:hypothetical protein